MTYYAFLPPTLYGHWFLDNKKKTFTRMSWFNDKSYLKEIFKRTLI